MSKKLTFNIGEYTNLGGFWKSLGFMYAGIIGESFSISIATNTVNSNTNLYFPINSEYITVQKSKLKVVEVHADRILVEVE